MPRLERTKVSLMHLIGQGAKKCSESNSCCGRNASLFTHSADGALITYYFPGTVMHTGDGFSKY